MTVMEQYIRQYSASVGLNPDIVMRTVMAEGGASSLEPSGYARQSALNYKGSQEQSYGPFQMFMGGGLGNRALRAGYDPRDPAQAFNVAKFAMDVMAKEGLGAWHGWKGGPWDAHTGKRSGETVEAPTPVAPTPGTSTAGAAGSPYALHARHPPNPQVGTGDYIQPGAPTTGTNGLPLTSDGSAVAVKNADDKDKYQKAASGAFDVFADMKAPVLGANGNAPKMPTLSPLATESSPIVTPGGGSDARNQLALLMQKLNANRLVG